MAMTFDCQDHHELQEQTRSAEKIVRCAKGEASSSLLGKFTPPRLLQTYY